MRKKKQIHCRCGSPAEWYKKGKNHRVLICARCGMIANNPAPLIAAGLSMAAPYVIEKGAQLLGGKKKDAGDSQVIVTDSKDRPNYGERVINQVMRSEGL